MHQVVIILVAIPVAAILILFFLRRSSTWSALVPALTLSGITGSILTACCTFLSSTIPIAPYETGPGTWTQVLIGLLLALSVGFGLGVLMAAIVGVPYWHISGRAKGD